MNDTPDDAELLAPWYIGAMNDAPFIINAPSRPANDHPWHDTPHGPSLALLAHPLPNKRIEAIVDAHNATVNFAAARIRELEAQLADGSFYKEDDIDALQARADRADAARLIQREAAG